MKVSIRNRQRGIKVNSRKTASLLRKLHSLLRLPGAEVSVLFVGDRRMRMLNRDYRGADRTTDVLAFPQYRARDLKTEIAKRSLPRASNRRAPSVVLPLGDIVINLRRTRLQARENGVPFGEELKKLLVHGLLHLIGYDHEHGGTAARKMREKTRELIKKLG